MTDKTLFLNKKYSSLCQQLGDSILKLEQLQSHIENLKSQISTLNAAFPLMAEFDSQQLKDINKDHSND